MRSILRQCDCPSHFRRGNDRRPYDRRLNQCRRHRFRHRSCQDVCRLNCSVPLSTVRCKITQRSLSEKTCLASFPGKRFRGHRLRCSRKAGFLNGRHSFSTSKHPEETLRQRESGETIDPRMGKFDIDRIDTLQNEVSVTSQKWRRKRYSRS